MNGAEQWNSEVLRGGGLFTQSWEWGEFHSSLGWPVERVSGENFLSQVSFRPLPAGANEAYVPYGPVLLGGEVQEDNFWGEMKRVISKKTAFFEFDLFVDVPFLSPRTISTRQPLDVRVVPIAGRDLASLSESFHPTLRENLSRAERVGLVLEQESDWESFFSLYVRTMEKHGLRSWHREYIESLWATLAPSGMAEIWSAKKGGRTLATNLYIVFGSRVTHLFAGSSDEEPSAQAPHWLHWQMMASYAARGVGEYDLGKVGSGLTGLTTFKERFGGRTESYPGNVIVPIRRFYVSMYRFAKKLSR